MLSDKQLPAAQATAKRARGPPIDPRTRVQIPSDPFMESVYALIPEDYTPPAHEPRYRSKFSKQARDEYWTGIRKAASLGPAKVSLAPPKDYLKKQAGITIPKVSTSTPRVRVVRKAALPAEPSQKGPILMRAAVPKDYVKINAIENINSVAKQPKCASPSFLLKKDYGKNPKYNQKIIKDREIQKKQSEESQAAEIAQRETQALREQGLVALPEEERIKILEVLKSNWEKVRSDYQRLSLTVDTVPKIARKVNMEKQLKEYEELIAKFSNTNIHVKYDSLSTQ